MSVLSNGRSEKLRLLLSALKFLDVKILLESSNDEKVMKRLGRISLATWSSPRSG